MADSRPSMFSFSLGQELASVRNRAEMTVSALAAQLSISTKMVTNIEKGHINATAELVVNWCLIAHADPGHVLMLAADGAAASSVEEIAIVIDLRQIADRKYRYGWQKEMVKWATNQLATMTRSPQLTLRLHDIDRLADSWSISTENLLITLKDYVPLDQP